SRESLPDEVRLVLGPAREVHDNVRVDRACPASQLRVIVAAARQEAGASSVRCNGRLAGRLVVPQRPLNLTNVTESHGRFCREAYTEDQRTYPDEVVPSPLRSDDQASDRCHYAERDQGHASEQMRPRRLPPSIVL